MEEFLEKLLPKLQTSLGDDQLTIHALPLSPSKQLVAAVFCQFRQLHGSFRKRDGSSQEFFLEVAKRVFNLDPPASHGFVAPTTLCTQIKKRILDVRAKGGSTWAKQMNDDYSSAFYAKLSAPMHWSVPEGDLADTLKAEVTRMTTNGVDVNSIKIFTTTECVDLLGNDPNATRGIIPKGSIEIEDENFALFYLDGKRGWRLDMLLCGGTPYAADDPREEAKNAARDIFEWSVENGTCQTNVQSRTGTDPNNREAMVMFGVRFSFNANIHGEHFGIRCENGRIMFGEEALGSVLMSRMTQLFVAPFFQGALSMLREACAEFGANILPSWHPFTLMAITRNYCNGAHKDIQDLIGGFIVWVHAGKGELKGGEFVVTTHGCHFTPRDGSCLYLRSPDIAHYSVPPETTGTRCQIGVALAARKNVITGFRNQLEKYLAKVGAGRLFTTAEDIPDKLQQRFHRFLAFFKISSKTKKTRRVKNNK